MSTAKVTAKVTAEATADLTQRLRIAISPELSAAAGAAVHWTWRQLLSALGWTWEEVALDAPCDVAHVTAPSECPQAKLCIHAHPAAWKEPKRFQLTGIMHHSIGPIIRYAGDNEGNGTGNDTGNGTRNDTEPGVVLLADGRRWIERDLLFDLFFLLTGQDEGRYPQDKHGFYDLSASQSYKEGQHLHAPASFLINYIRSLLESLDLTPQFPAWPHGKRAAIAISHDVDYPEVVRWLEPLRIMQRQGRRGLRAAWEIAVGQRTHWHFHNWMHFEQRYGMRSAFYFVARQGSLLEYRSGTPDPFYDITAPHFREVFATLLQGGWEVGLHASYHAYRSPAIFAQEKQRLEEQCGCAVVGNRHHYWHMDPNNVEQTLRLHAELGFLYDSSLAHDAYIGWRRSSCLPFYPFHQPSSEEITSLQLPVGWMDAQLFGSHIAPAERHQVLSELLHRAIEQRGLFLINIHDYVFDSVLFPGWLDALQHVLELACGRSDIWLATPQEIAQFWQSRYKQIVQNSIGLHLGLPVDSNSSTTINRLSQNRI